MNLRMAVACYNSNGEPDIYFCRVRCTEEQYNNGDHYDAAITIAKEQGYEGTAPIAFDEYDRPELMTLFEWNGHFDESDIETGKNKEQLDKFERLVAWWRANGGFDDTELPGSEVVMFLSALLEGEE